MYREISVAVVSAVGSVDTCRLSSSRGAVWCARRIWLVRRRVGGRWIAASGRAEYTALLAYPQSCPQVWVEAPTYDAGSPATAPREALERLRRNFRTILAG